MKKLLGISLALVLALGLLAGCGNKGGDGDDPLVARAKEVIDLINSGDYDALSGVMREDLREGLEGDVWEQALKPYMDEVGAFKEYTDAATTVREEEPLGELTIIQLKAQYEKHQMFWSVWFDADGEVVGLYLNQVV